MERTIQLYSLATPNGQKVAIALEEMQLPYEAHTVNILKGEQFEPEFLKINPNGKIPAIVDPEPAPGKGPLAIMESGAILLHLAEKSGMFLSKDPVTRSETLQWLFFQVGGVGPMFGQFGHFFKYAKDKCDHDYPVERYKTEAKRLLKVLDQRLEGREYLAGDISIADFATAPWVIGLEKFYNATEALELESFANVQDWVRRFSARPAVEKGMAVTPIRLS